MVWAEGEVAKPTTRHQHNSVQDWILKTPWGIHHTQWSHRQRGLSHRSQGECQPLGTSPNHVEVKESEKAPSFHGTLVTGSEPAPPVLHDEGPWMESEHTQSYPPQRHDGPVTGSVHAQPVSHLWNGPSGTAPSQSTHSYGCEPEMGYGLTGRENLTTRLVTGPRGLAGRGGRGFLVLLPNTSFHGCLPIPLLSIPHTRCPVSTEVTPGQPSTSRSTPIHAGLTFLMIIIQPVKMGVPRESQMLLAQLPAVASESEFYTHTVKTNQPACASVASARS